MLIIVIFLTCIYVKTLEDMEFIWTNLEVSL